MFLGYAYLLYPIAAPSTWAASKDKAPEEAVVKAASTTEEPPPVPTICGDIIGYANEDLDRNFLFDAYSVHECLTSVPFNDAVASRFVEYYNTTMQFQSTLAYLKNPPAGYQQPAVDVVSVLDQIQHNITNGNFKNQYDFEATVQSLVYAMHDSHVNLAAGALSAFTFGSPYELMSVSVDGKQAPQVYVADDIIDSSTQGWTPSPIVSINGENVVDYLRKFAKVNSVGLLEEHADWNQLMYNPVQDILGTYNIFGWDTTFYPGDELHFTFANATKVESIWLAFYRNFQQTGALTTGGDFYNYFVLGLLPVSYNDGGEIDSSDISDNSTDAGNEGSDGGDNSQPAGAASWFDESPAYPNNPDVVQPGLAIDESGFLTGYFYRDVSVAVLSVPSFDEYGDDIGTFSNTTSTFIQQAKDAGLNHVVIDLQQNTGGASLLAVDTFKKFFPNIDPYTGSRRRSHRLGKILGATMTDFWNSLTPDNTEYDYDDYYYPLSANEFVITPRLDAATGRNFTSWEQYAGPVVAQGDKFSLVEKYNLSSSVFDQAAFGGYIPYGYYPDSDPDDMPWAPQNIVLLTDGICGSTCSLFVELMAHQAGVHTVVVGGVPAPGPMQIASGSRGARAFTADQLDANMAFAAYVNETANNTLPKVRDSGMYVFTVGFNLRDQIREGEDVPRQFQYDAAQCRIYYTLANAYNMTRLWRDAAAATWNDTSLCVSGSTGFAKAANSTKSANPAPKYTGPADHNFDGAESAYDAGYTEDFGDGIQDAVNKKQSGSFGPCQKSTCASTKCATVTCANGISSKVCQPPCDNVGGSCANGQGICKGSTKTVESKARTASGQSSNYGHESFHKGYCVPLKEKYANCLKSNGPDVPH